MNIANIGVGVYADLARLHSGLRDGQSAVLLFAGAAATALGTVATAAIAAGLAIDDAMDGIRISTGATGSALQGLEGSFDRVFANVPSSAGDASTAIAQLNVRTGQTGVGLENLSTRVLTLARITKEDLNGTVTESTRLFASWGIEQAKQSSTLDMVLRASQQTGIGVGALLQTMVTAGPVFRAAGYDFATSAALLGTFEKAGVNGQRAVASLTAAFRFFAKEGIDAKKGVEQTIARIQELGPSAAASALGVKVFGRSAVDMVAAIQSGRLNVEQLAAAISNGSDTIMSAAQATDGFTETLAKLRNNVVLALEPFGTAVLAQFNAAMVGILAPSKALLGTLNLLAQATIALAAATASRLTVSFVASTRAKIADLIATQAARVANVQHTAAVAAQAQAQFVAATAALNAARAETALTGSLVAQRAALAAVSTAHAQAAAATAAHTAAMNAASISARAAAGSMGLLRGALAFLGGPIGLAITVALTAIGVGFFNAGRKARQAAADARQAAEDFRAALATMDEATFAAAAAATRANYGISQRTFDRQSALIRQQREEVARLRAMESGGSAAARGKGAVVISPELRAAEQRLREQEARLRGIQGAWQGTAANLRTIKEQEAAIARQRAAMPDPPGGGTGPGALPWEGAAESAAEAQRAVEQLATRVSALTDVFDVQRAQGMQTASVMGELNRLYEDAAGRLGRMGDAASLSPDVLKDYQSLLNIVNQLKAAGMSGVGAAATRAPTGAAGFSGAARAPAGMADLSFSAVKESALQAGRFLTEQSVHWRNALAEGAQAAADRLKAATDNVRSLWAGLMNGFSGAAGDFVNMFNAVRERQAASGAGGGLGGIVAAAGPAAGFMVAMEFFNGLMTTLGPALQALMTPIALVGEMLGGILVPVIKALFVPMKLLATAFTYVQTAIGWLVRAIGKAIDKIPGVSGGPLIRAGQTMMDGAESVRKKLAGLTFDEAQESANQLAESLSNIPPIFDYLARRRQAAIGGALPTPAPTPTPAPAPAPSPPSGGGRTEPGGENATVRVTHFGERSIVVIATPGQDAEDLARQLLRIVQTEGNRGGPTPLSAGLAKLVSQSLAAAR